MKLKFVLSILLTVSNLLFANTAPVIGHTTSDEVSVWCAAESGSTVKIHYKKTSEGSYQTSTFEQLSDEKSLFFSLSNTTYDDYPYLPFKVKVRGLKADTTYDYYVSVDGNTSSKLTGTFKTAPVANVPKKFRVVMSSCVDLSKGNNHAAWDILRNSNPDLHLLVGDNAYVDSSNTKMHWKKHLDVRDVTTIEKAYKSIPSYSTWDDHDYGKNNGGAEYSGKANALKMWKYLWPNPEMGLDGTPGVFYKFSWADVEFFVIDARYHRDTTLLGSAQATWLHNSLKQSNATFKVIVGGCRWDDDDGWGDFANSRRNLLNVINDNKINGVFYISGDLHKSKFEQHNEDRIDYPLVELVSSGIGKSRYDNLERTFMILDFDTTLSDPKITATIKGVDKNGNTLSSSQIDSLINEPSNEGLHEGGVKSWKLSDMSYDTPPPVTDTDGDGISDEDEENLYGTNKNTKDSDNDGIDDGDELTYWGNNWNADSDNDGIINLLDADSDNDGTSDGVEIANGTDPGKDEGDGPFIEILDFPIDEVTCLPSGSDVTLEVEAFDPDGIDKIAFYSDKTGEMTREKNISEEVDGVYTYTFTNLADGTYNFMVRLIDAGDPVDRSLYSEIVTIKIGEGGEDPNLIFNGNFSQNLEGWEATVKESVANLGVVDGLFIADIEQPPAKNWQVNLKQSNISMVAGASYTLSLDAVATKADGQTSIARKIAFRIKDSNGDKILWKSFTIDSSEMAPYQHTFTNELGSSSNCELMIFMGYEDNPNVLYLDNIELIAN